MDFLHWFRSPDTCDRLRSSGLGAITWIKAYNFYTARDLDRGWASSLTAKAAMALRRLAPGFGWKGGTQIGAYIIYICVCSYIYIYTYSDHICIYLYVKQPNIDLYDSWCAIYLQIVHVHHAPAALWFVGDLLDSLM